MVANVEITLVVTQKSFLTANLGAPANCAKIPNVLSPSEVGNLEAICKEGSGRIDRGARTRGGEIKWDSEDTYSVYIKHDSCLPSHPLYGIASRLRNDRIPKMKMRSFLSPDRFMIRVIFHVPDTITANAF